MKLKPLTAVAILASVLFVSPGNGEQWFFVPETGEPNPIGLATIDKYAFEVGDDNGDGYITEDESGWDCATMGNRVCATGPYAHEHGDYVGGYN